MCYVHLTFTHFYIAVCALQNECELCTVRCDNEKMQVFFFFQANYENTLYSTY
jgi:hypothetical protein